MGFRSTFISEDIGGRFADWFVEKWSPVINFGDGNGLPISSKHEAKIYSQWEDLIPDIQKALDWDAEIDELTLVWFHECTGITRVEIRPESVLYNEPDGWRDVEKPTHHYCYGCSEANEIERVLDAVSERF